MGKIVDLDMAETSHNMALTDASIAASGNPLYTTDDQSVGTLGTIYEMYMHETWIGNAMRYGLVPNDKLPGTYDYQDPDFNPFRYYLDNRDEYMDIDASLKNGLFDNVVTEAQFQDRAARLRKEMESKERIANGTGLGMLLGGALSFVDVSTFVPGIGWMNRAKTAGRVGKLLATRPAKYAIAGGYYSAVQEAGLHTMQDLRTLEESGYNTAGGIVLGGVIGGAAVGLSKSSPLHPSNPNYIFRPESKVSLGIKSVGESVSNSAVLQPVFKGGRKTYEVVAGSSVGQSVGAAAVRGTELLKGGAVKGAGIVGNTIRATGKVFQAGLENTVGQASPIIRGLTSKSQIMMNITESLYDLGGVLTKGHTRGEYKASVEDIANNISTHFDTNILIKAREHFLGLQERLAKITGDTRGRTRRAWDNFKDDAGNAINDVRRPSTKSGETASKPMNLESSGGNFREWEFERVIEATMREHIPDEMMTNLVNRFGKEGADEIIKFAKAMGEDIHGMNKMIEDMMVEHGLITEKQRLGRDYVSMQGWDGKGIRANKDAARIFFHEVFGRKPSDEFLDSYRMTPEQFEKLGKEDVTITWDRTKPDGSVEKVSNTIKAGADGEGVKLEILDDWAGDIYNNDLARIELELRNAEDAVARTKQNAILAARELRKANTEFRNASVDEAKAVLQARQADREAAVARREKLRLEKQKLETEVKRLEEEERIARETPITERQLRTGEVKQAEDLMNSLKGDDTATAKDWSYAQENLTNADINAEAAARRRNVERNKSAHLIRLRNNLTRINRDLNKLERRLPILEQKLDRLSKLVDDAVAARTSQADLLKLREKAKRQSSKDAAKARRQVKTLTKRLEKKENGDHLGIYVEKLVDNLGKRDGSGSMPMGHGIETDLVASARTKMRMIKLTPEQRIRAQELGLLRSDFMGSLHEGVADLSRRIAFRQVFGHMGKSDQEILDALKKSVEDDWNVIISKAQKAGRTERHLQKLRNQRDRNLDDVQQGVERQLGVLHLPKDAEGVLHWMGAKLREWNFIRYGSGFLIPSLTDLSNVALTSGFGTMSYKNLKALNGTIKGMNNTEIRRLATALELLMHNSRNMKMSNTDDIRHMAGIGNYGTRTHKYTAMTDQAFNGLGRATNYMSGMLWWNTRLKMLAMIEMQHNFTQAAIKWDELITAASAGGKGSNKAQLEITKFASLGLGKAEMDAIRRMMAKHPPEESDGILELGMGRWLNEGPEGQRAYQYVMNALEHTANRAVMTPGKGDTPFFMSHAYGKTLMQFQTYGFAIMTRYMEPAFQRMATYGDMEAFLSFGLALATGTGVVVAKDLINNGEIKERDVGAWAYDVIDRSGFLTYMSPYLAGAAQYMGEAPSRYSRERGLVSILGGPSGGLAEDIYGTGTAVLAGDTDRAAALGGKLLPFSMYQKIFKVIFGDD